MLSTAIAMSTAAEFCNSSEKTSVVYICERNFDDVLSCLIQSWNVRDRETWHLNIACCIHKRINSGYALHN